MFPFNQGIFSSVKIHISEGLCWNYKINNKRVGIIKLTTSVFTTNSNRYFPLVIDIISVGYTGFCCSEPRLYRWSRHASHDRSNELNHLIIHKLKHVSFWCQLRRKSSWWTPFWTQVITHQTCDLSPLLKRCHFSHDCLNSQHSQHTSKLKFSFLIYHFI